MARSSFADVAQLVARNLAKVQVAGSTPVVRSDWTIRLNRVRDRFGGVAERRGSGLQIPLHGFKSRLHLDRFRYNLIRTISAAVAHFLDMEGVTGSIPVSSTIFTTGSLIFRLCRPTTRCLAISANSPMTRLPLGGYVQTVI